VNPNYDRDPDRDGVDTYYDMGGLGNVLDPTNRDSDSDGTIDGLDANPCYSDITPFPHAVEDPRPDTDGDGFPDAVEAEAGTNPNDAGSRPLPPEPDIDPPLSGGTPADSDGDGFCDTDERIAGTNPEDPDDHPAAYTVELDLDDATVDRIWLEDVNADGTADAVVIDIGSDLLADARVDIMAAAHVERGDYDADGAEDDARYTIRYEFANQRVRHSEIILIITDLGRNLRIASVAVVRE